MSSHMCASGAAEPSLRGAVHYLVQELKSQFIRHQPQKFFPQTSPSTPFKIERLLHDATLYVLIQGRK